MTEKIIPQEQVEKSEHRESSRLRNQPRSDSSSKLANRIHSIRHLL